MDTGMNRLLLGLLVLTGFATGQVRSLSLSGQDRIARPDKIVPPYQAQVRGTALEHPIEPADYIVGPGDRFIISILSPEPYIELATITPTGALVLPRVGTIPVKDLSAEAVSEQVLAFVQTIFPNYQATCALYGIREIRVSISGAVKRPGFHVVTPLSHLTDLMNLAGGVRPQAALHRIELSRDSEATSTLDLTRYYDEGELAQNPLLRGGDRIVIPYGDVNSDLVLVQGLASGLVYHAIRPQETLASFMRRIAHGKNADLTGVILQHQQDGETREQEYVAAARFESVLLEPGDVLFINPIADVAVVGEVRRPGRFAYQPGMKAADYVVYAGGVSRDGSPRAIEITRETGETVRGGDEEVRAGDTIYIARSFNSVFLGQLGMVQAALTFLNIYLAYLAASSR